MTNAQKLREALIARKDDFIVYSDDEDADGERTSSVYFDEEAFRRAFDACIAEIGE